VRPPAVKLAHGLSNRRLWKRTRFAERKQWFYGQREFPLGNIPAGARLKAVDQMRFLLKNTKAKQSSMAVGTEPSAQSASLANAITLSQTNWTTNEHPGQLPAGLIVGKGGTPCSGGL